MISLICGIQKNTNELIYNKNVWLPKGKHGEGDKLGDWD